LEKKSRREKQPEEKKKLALGLRESIGVEQNNESL